MCWMSLLIQPPCFRIPKAFRLNHMLHGSLSSSKAKHWFHISKGLIEFHPMEKHTSVFSPLSHTVQPSGNLRREPDRKKWDKVNLVLWGKWFQLWAPRHIPNTECLHCSIAFKPDRSPQKALTRMSWGLRELTGIDKAEPHHQTQEVHTAHSNPHTCTRCVPVYVCVYIHMRTFTYIFSSHRSPRPCWQ